MGFTVERWTEEEIAKAHRLFVVEGYTVSAAAKATGVSRASMAGVCARQGWFGKDRRSASDPVFARRRSLEVGPAIRATDAEIEAARLHRKRDAQYVMLLVQEAHRLGLIQVSQ